MVTGVINFKNLCELYSFIMVPVQFCIYTKFGCIRDKMQFSLKFRDQANSFPRYWKREPTLPPFNTVSANRLFKLLITTTTIR